MTGKISSLLGSAVDRQFTSTIEVECAPNQPLILSRRHIKNLFEIEKVRLEFESLKRAIALATFSTKETHEYEIPASAQFTEFVAGDSTFTRVQLDKVLIQLRSKREEFLTHKKNLSDKVETLRQALIDATANKLDSTIETTKELIASTERELSKLDENLTIQDRKISLCLKWLKHIGPEGVATISYPVSRPALASIKFAARKGLSNKILSDLVSFFRSMGKNKIRFVDISIAMDESGVLKAVPEDLLNKEEDRNEAESAWVYLSKLRGKNQKKILPKVAAKFLTTSTIKKEDLGDICLECSEMMENCKCVEPTPVPVKVKVDSTKAKPSAKPAPVPKKILVGGEEEFPSLPKKGEIPSKVEEGKSFSSAVKPIEERPSGFTKSNKSLLVKDLMKTVAKFSCSHLYFDEKNANLLQNHILETHRDLSKIVIPEAEMLLFRSLRQCDDCGEFHSDECFQYYTLDGRHSSERNALEHCSGSCIIGPYGYYIYNPELKKFVSRNYKFISTSDIDFIQKELPHVSDVEYLRKVCPELLVFEESPVSDDPVEELFQSKDKAQFTSLLAEIVKKAVAEALSIEKPKVSKPKKDDIIPPPKPTEPKVAQVAKPIAKVSKPPKEEDEKLITGAREMCDEIWPKEVKGSRRWLIRALLVSPDSAKQDFKSKKLTKENFNQWINVHSPLRIKDPIERVKEINKEWSDFKKSHPTIGVYQKPANKDERDALELRKKLWQKAKGLSEEEKKKIALPKVRMSAPKKKEQTRKPSQPQPKSNDLLSGLRPIFQMLKELKAIFV